MQRIVYCIAIAFAAQLHGCADTERESPPITDAAGAGIQYLETGSGDPVVLVHGFGQTHTAWLDTPLYSELVQDHKVIAVDLRGHGNSDQPHDPTAYGLNMQADLTNLLDQLGIEKAHFIGFSLGASVVGDVVVSSPERVQTATMGSGYFTTWNEAEEDFAQHIENRGQGDERRSWEPENQDYRALAAVVRGARYSAVSLEQIASIKTPTLMVFGSIEVENMPELHRDRLETLPSSVKVMIVEGADHDSSNAAILDPMFTQAVRDFIAANSTI